MVDSEEDLPSMDSVRTKRSLCSNWLTRLNNGCRSIINHLFALWYCHSIVRARSSVKITSAREGGRLRISFVLCCVFFGTSQRMLWPKWCDNCHLQMKTEHKEQSLSESVIKGIIKLVHSYCAQSLFWRDINLPDFIMA